MIGEIYLHIVSGLFNNYIQGNCLLRFQVELYVHLSELIPNVVVFSQLVNTLHLRITTNVTLSNSKQQIRLHMHRLSINKGKHD